MQPLFRRRSNSIARGILLAIFALGAAALSLMLTWKWTTWETEVGVAYRQPVPFSHQHHVSQLGLDCRYCHTSVETSATAGMPPSSTCRSCHSQIWRNAPLLAPVRETASLPWARVYRLPKYVYFNHSIHVRQGVGCTSCHGDIAAMPLMRKAGAFYMKDCLACHREPERYLRPRAEVFNPHYISPPGQAALGARLVEEYRIPKGRLTDCGTCHR